MSAPTKRQLSARHLNELADQTEETALDLVEDADCVGEVK